MNYYYVTVIETGMITTDMAYIIIHPLAVETRRHKETGATGKCLTGIGSI